MRSWILSLVLNWYLLTVLNLSMRFWILVLDWYLLTILILNLRFKFRCQILDMSGLWSFWRCGRAFVIKLGILCKHLGIRWWDVVTVDFRVLKILWIFFKYLWIFLHVNKAVGCVPGAHFVEIASGRSFSDNLMKFHWNFVDSSYPSLSCPFQN